jgi:hypothetical protein
MHSNINAKPSEIIYENRATARTSHPEKIFPAAINKRRGAHFADLPEPQKGPLIKEARDVLKNVTGRAEALSQLNRTMKAKTDDTTYATIRDIISQVAIIEEDAKRLKVALLDFASGVTNDSLKRKPTIKLMALDREVTCIDELIQEVIENLLEMSN